MVRHPLSRLFSLLLVLAAFVCLTGFTSKTILIDGDVSDWNDVLVDDDNAVADLASFSDPADPDDPGTADRDMRAFALTWDADNLYFFLRRTLSGNNSFNFLVYIDIDHSGTLDANDFIANWDYNGSDFQLGELIRYVPSNPAGDPITGDGQDEPGSNGSVVGGTSLTGANSQDGIEFEVALPWQDLGVAPGTCMWFHGSVSNGTNLPGQVQDNADPIDGKIVKMSLVSEQIGTTSSPGTIRYAHTVCQLGNCADLIDISTRSDRGYGVRIYSDPDGDGDPSDGTLIAEDQNGDGDFSDDADTIDPAADTNGNDLIDAGDMSEGECASYVVELVVPRRVPQDRIDRIRVRARSAYRASATLDNFDTTKIGAIVLYPNRNMTGQPGATVDIPHEACNNQSDSDTIDLSVSDTLGWSLQIWSDPDGDGDPSDGTQIGNTGILASGECLPLVLRTVIPAGAPVGDVDSLTLLGTSRNNSDVVTRVDDLVKVADAAISLDPDHDVNAGPADTIYLAHTITNNVGVDDFYTLSAVTALGSTVIFLTDPNGDGLPEDSDVIPPGTPVGPVSANGGSLDLIAKIITPTGVGFPDIETVTVTAESTSSNETATAVDTIRIQKLLTYSDPLFARPTQEWFSTCATIYAQGYGLQTNSTYRFVWTNPLGAQIRLGPEIKPDRNGRVDDSYTMTCTDLPGLWTVKIQIKQGSSWVDEPDAITSFNILDPSIGEGGDITSLRTSREVYNFENDSVGVSATLHNDTLADYIGTSIAYVIFLDANGDGEPTDGETFIQEDGSRATYTFPLSFTHVTRGISILSGKTYEDLWRVDNVDFQEQTEWCVYAFWATDCNCGPIQVDTALTCFDVSCFPVPLIDAGVEKEACPGDVVVLDDASSDGDLFGWEDGAAGGTFAPVSSILNPSYSNSVPGDYTLRLTCTFASNGCLSEDSVLFTVHPRPTLEAGSDKFVCAGEPAFLSDANQSGGTQFQWDDMGSDGSFDPSDTALNPTYTNAAVGDYTLTLSVTDGSTTAACSDVDTMTVSVNPFPVIDAGVDKATCTSQAVSLSDATQTGGTSVSWTDNGGAGLFSPSASELNPDYQNGAPGIYDLALTVVDRNTPAACESLDTMTVQVLTDPISGAGGDQTITCNRTVVDLSGSGVGGSGNYSYRWEPSDQVSDPNIPNPTTNIEGTYTLFVTDNVTGCIAEDTMVVDTSNQVPTAIAGENKVIDCRTSQVTLDGDATGGNGRDGYGFRWEPAADVSDPDIATPTTTVPGIYTLTVTDIATGCIASDAVTVIDNTSPPITEAGEPFTLTCAEPDHTLQGLASGGDGSQGYEYRWEPAGQVSDPDIPQPTTSQPDTYTLTVTDTASGCVSMDQVVIDEDKETPVVDAGPDKALTCEVRSATLEGAASGGSGDYVYSWEPAAQVSDPDIPQPTTSEGGDYTLTVTDRRNGCFSSDVATVDPIPVLEPVEPSAVDLDPAVEPLRVRKDTTGEELQLEFTWEDTGFAHSLYRGTLGALAAGFYNHAPMGACQIQGPTTTTVSTVGNLYYLIVSEECVANEESSYGRGTFQGERPDALTASGTRCQ